MIGFRYENLRFFLLVLAINAYCIEMAAKGVIDNTSIEKGTCTIRVAEEYILALQVLQIPILIIPGDGTVDRDDNIAGAHRHMRIGRIKKRAIVSCWTGK